MASIAPFKIFGSTSVYQLADGSFVALSGADVDGDGSGGNLENDPDFQATTTYIHSDGTYVNSRKEKGFVIPEALALAIEGVCIGCQGRVVDTIAGLVSPAFVHDIGPDDRFGEQTIALASFMGVNPNPVSGGTTQPRFYYQFWPNKAAVVGGEQYSLRPLSALV